MYAELAAQGVHVGRKRIARLMTAARVQFALHASFNLKRWWAARFSPCLPYRFGAQSDLDAHY
jgi:hypothetical protein